MVSLTISTLSLIRNLIGKPSRTFVHSFNLPFPKTIHKYIDQSFVEKYDEIFVIGDIHGCFDELQMLLKKAEAEKDSTLKIIVGDLVNKGPKNAEVLDYLRQSASILAVRGNHDEVVLKEYFSAKNPSYELKASNRWIKDLSLENINYLLELPFTISIPSLNVVVVHAGLLPGMPIEANDPFNMVCMRNVIEGDYFWEGGLTASKHIDEGEPWASMWGGPQHVYFGHDAKRMLQKYPFATGLDTGCVYGNWLTGVFINGPRKGTFYNVKAKQVYSKTKSNE
ncbi:bis(5'-nucleosyl)-tetraphosphatase, symmetrical-like [Uloborus diversus]|uniref:bis(5'-nucleosyl)-tetraphosphatase, symmetrical-like n=1 Tax=Uloborus diversus TaxID=327109 RepID=UPI0024099BCA|nr:bis(5'-nucleosyl)-tetraphosphatase, symmetrical-like [Uloborus diversus]